jgi:branched-subunit amino acid ABC-type transport system permease component
LQHLTSLFFGLGNGGVYAALALALVLTYRSSGVVNFATGAMALYAAYTYAGLREGQLIVPACRRASTSGAATWGSCPPP